MRCLRLTPLIFLCLLALVPFAFGDIYYNADTYPFTFPTYDTAMGFSTDMTFQRAYRESDYWYFNTATVSQIGFQVQTANLAITDLFASDIDTLKFTVSASSGQTSTTKIYVGDRGEPTDVIGATSWSYADNILTITKLHSSDANIEVQWGEGGDSEPPTYSNVGTNTTHAGKPCKFYTYWQDNVDLSHYIFSWNSSGSWANDTKVAFSTNPAWSNITKTLPSIVGQLLGWRIYANDTSNNWNNTGIQTLTTTDTTAPTYSNVSTSTTVANASCIFSVKWTNLALSGYIFGTNNTGTWQNDTWTDPWSGTPTSGWVTVAKTLNGTVGVLVQWKVWCNDTSNNWGNTGILTLTISEEAEHSDSVANIWLILLPLFFVIGMGLYIFKRAQKGDASPNEIVILSVLFIIAVVLTAIVLSVFYA